MPRCVRVQWGQTIPALARRQSRLPYVVIISPAPRNRGALHLPAHPEKAELFCAEIARAGISAGGL
jgi:hypothetical protein